MILDVAYLVTEYNVAYVTALTLSSDVAYVTALTGRGSWLGLCSPADGSRWMDGLPWRLHVLCGVHQPQEAC